MRRLTTAFVTALFGLAVAIPAMATPATQTVEFRAVDTHAFGIPADQLELVPGAEPGFNWLSDSIWHMRNIPVTDTLESLDGSTTVGSMVRTVNFNWDLASGDSTAWCSFAITLDDPALGTFEGHCRGSLIDGTVVGYGPAGHLQGTWFLEPGGIPSVGPYVISVEISGS